MSEHEKTNIKRAINAVESAKKYIGKLKEESKQGYYLALEFAEILLNDLLE